MMSDEGQDRSPSQDSKHITLQLGQLQLEYSGMIVAGFLHLDTVFREVT